MVAVSPGLTTERVYHVLKTQIMTGDLRPGDRLDPARLASELNASTTPVRDALHQLLGERMVHAFPQQGFQVPVLSETALRELYGWTSDLLALLLRIWRGASDMPPPCPPSRADIADTTATFFDAIVSRLGTSEHRRAIRHASDRLHRVRTIEGEILAGVFEEIETLIAAWMQGSAADLRSGLQRYHRRRLSAVPAIVARLTTEIHS
jgi:DNA-binding transcriptional MocR family regulator